MHFQIFFENFKCILAIKISFKCYQYRHISIINLNSICNLFQISLKCKEWYKIYLMGAIKVEIFCNIIHLNLSGTYDDRWLLNYNERKRIKKRRKKSLNFKFDKKFKRFVFISLSFLGKSNVSSTKRFVHNFSLHWVHSLFDIGQLNIMN